MLLITANVACNYRLKTKNSACKLCTVCT